MSKEIRYDFAKSKRCADAIEAAAAAIDADVVRKKGDTMLLINEAVDCLSTNVLLEKLDGFMTESAELKNELLLCAETLRQLTQRMRFAEEEARRIALTGEGGE